MEGLTIDEIVGSNSFKNNVMHKKHKEDENFGTDK